jgi:glutathione S-transferase
LKSLPILYSFRRCPYAIRARMALKYSGIAVEIREVKLNNKPQQMLDYSPKGTVPVLILDNDKVIDESLDIMLWAISQHDPNNWQVEGFEQLIDENDNVFKKHLDQYKYSIRYPENSKEYYRQQGKIFLQQLEQRLQQHKYLLCEQITIADVAIFPFIRQYAHVDKQWFDQTPYRQLQSWLNEFLQSDLFHAVMNKNLKYLNYN